MALKTGNESLLINLSSGGDASSNELYYHGHCNHALWNDTIRIEREQSSAVIEGKWKRAQSFNSIISYIHEQHSIDPGSTFAVKDLNELYIENLKSFNIEEKPQTTRFTERLIASVPNLVCRTVSKKTVVLFDETVQDLIDEYVQTPDDFYSALRKVVHPIRSHILKQDNKFTGSFSNSCQVNSVPKTLLALTSALIDGEMTSSSQPSQEALSVAQIVVSHTRRPVKRKAKVKKPSRRRHNQKQETPLVQYVGLKIFYTSRSRQLIDDLYHIGLSISYDRVLELIQMFYEELRRGYILHGCFFPRILRKSLFTVWLKDNIDVNPKANFNTSSYHGTSSSVIQFRQNIKDGEEFPLTQFPETVNRESKKLAPLPCEYTNVKNIHPIKFTTELYASPSPNHVSPTKFPSYEFAVNEELAWLSKCTDILSKVDVSIPGWASHHSSQKRVVTTPSGINTILPLHRDKVSTFNMQSHLMHLNKKWTAILNPNQTPVDVSDQPVYALTKELILRFPGEFSNYFALFGQLHIEQCILVTHGQLIKGSGLLEILTENKFSMIGLSAVVDVNNIKRARYTLQITLCSMFKLLSDAIPENCELSPYDWLTKKSTESTSFLYWKLVIDLEILILMYVRSIREGNFKLHVEILYLMLSWFFIFDHVHYARWLTIHWFDLFNLQSTFPDLFEQFSNGGFTFQKSDRPFSRMGLDQIHEQNNKVIKGAGGASDLLNRGDDSALLRWEVCSPELARLILEYEDCLDKNDIPAESKSKHHEDNESFNKRFSCDVSRLVKSVAANPFTNDDLTKLNNPKVVMPNTVRDVIEDMKKCGEEQLSTFILDRLVSAKVPISQTISTNKFDIWDCSEKVDKVEFSPTKATLKKMNAACESRKIQAGEVFQNEINNIPQSLSVIGKKGGIDLYHGNKSDITKRFPSPISFSPVHDPESQSSIVVEMSPLIRAKAFVTHTGNLTNFGEFSLLIYYEVTKLASQYRRIDLVFDRYFDQSLKEATREGRGEGSKYSLEGDSTEIPIRMGENFLKNSENKNQLNEYLAKKLLELHQGNQLMIVSYRNTALSSSSSCLELDENVPVRPCTAEEADQRLVRHALNIIKSGYKNVLVRTIDTDVLVLLLAHIPQVDDVNINAYLINSEKYYDVQKIIRTLGPITCKALPFFYAFSGCDIVSSFYGKGKCKMYDIWMNCSYKDEMTELFTQLGKSPSDVTDNQMSLLERYILELYGSRASSLGSARLDRFNKSSDNDLRALPPSRDALRQHVLRACYQSGYLWRQSVEEVVLPDPKDWGWDLDTVGAYYNPVWTTNQSSVSIKDFTKTCSCKTGKCKSCNCASAKLPCLSMCGCGKSCRV